MLGPPSQLETTATHAATISNDNERAAEGDLVFAPTRCRQ
jgi:hypothetical protein